LYTLGQVSDNSALKLAIYDGSQYDILTSASTAFAPGTGYWAHPGAATHIYDVSTDTIASVSYSVSLHQGWNIIGDPWSSSANASSIAIVDSSGVQHSLAAAAANSLIGPNLYTWQPSDTAYETQSAGSSSVLAAYEGYWIYVFQPCSVLFEGTSGGGSI
jgi:hypothetical protein